MLVALVLLSASRVAAQADASARLESIPFELPFELLHEETDDDLFAQVLAVPYDECVSFFQDALEQDSELAPGWTVGGQGLDTAEQHWRFGLLYEHRILYDVIVRRDSLGCRVEVGADADPIPGGRYRWSYPPLRLSDGTEIVVDPLVIQD
ncbi:MAG: hypothetical protein ACJAYU_001582 [Bradymonadia bacterium]|jgi:hypothetical protein